jgi:hypothetical protein
MRGHDNHDPAGFDGAFALGSALNAGFVPYLAVKHDRDGVNGASRPFPSWHRPLCMSRARNCGSVSA